MLDSRQAPFPGATVVLLPELDRRLLRTDLYRTTSTDTDFAWQDPAFMRDYEDRGRAVRVTAGARQTVDLEKN